MARDLKGILKSIAWVSSSNYVNSALAIVRGILFARLLGPASYGVWGFLSTVQTLSLNADLGERQVAMRDMPRLQSSGMVEEVETLAALTRWWPPLSCLLLGSALAVLWPVLGWPAAPGWAIVVPAVLAGMAAFMGAMAVETGSLAFRRYSLIGTASGAIGLLSGVAMSWAFGVTGLALSQAIVYGCAAMAAALMRPAKASLRALVRELGRAVSDGWRLLLPAVSLQAFTSVDVFVAARFTTTAEVGLYSIALLGASMAGSVIAGGVGSVVGQHLLKETAESGSGKPAAAMVWGPPAALAVVLAPACAVAALLTPPALGLLLPKYVAATAPAVVLLTAAYYLHSQFGFSTTFVAADRPLATVPVYWVLIVVNIAVDMVLLSLGWRLVAIAAGTLVVNATFMVVHQLLIGIMITGGRREVAQGVLTFFAGLVPAGAALAALGHVWWGATIGIAGVAAWAGLVWVARSWLGRGWWAREGGAGT